MSSFDKKEVPERQDQCLSMKAIHSSKNGH